MRLLPNSLLGRLVLVFVVGVTCTLGLMLIAQTPDRELANFRVCAGRAAHRLTDFLKLTDQLPVASRDKLAQVAQARGVRMSFAAQPAVASAPEAGSYPALFREAMLDDLRRDRPIAVDVKPLDHVRFEPGQTGAMDGFDFKVEAPLSDGTWVALEVQEPRRLSRYPTRTLNNLLTMVVVMSLLSFVAVRWVTRPLHRLADAAEALGRDINRPPLPENGPLEVRRAAKAFNSMQERLARYIRNRTGILTAMSHDLKTPITRLRLRAELLEQADLREKFVRDLSEMEHMVNSTLSFMRGLDDREPLRPIDVRALAEALQADAEELGHPVVVVGQPLSPFPESRRASSARCRICWTTRYATAAILRSRSKINRTCSRSSCAIAAPAFPKRSWTACSSRSIGWRLHAIPAPAGPAWVFPSHATSLSRWAASSRCAIAKAADWRRGYRFPAPSVARARQTPGRKRKGSGACRP